MKVKLIILSVLTLGLFLVLPTTATANTSTKLYAAIVPMCQQNNPADTTIFKTRIENKEYQVWFEIDFYKQNILVPNQKLFGEVPGYLGAVRDSRKWIITDVKVEGNTATLTIINDYGSEDLIATLTYNADGTYTFKQGKGSTINIAVNNKWVKLPKTMLFK